MEYRNDPEAGHSFCKNSDNINIDMVQNAQIFQVLEI